MSLRVLSAGLGAILVDAGRVGRRYLGIAGGGPADRRSMQLGNGLIGNSPLAPALELSLAGPTLQAEKSVGCIIAGAPFDVSRDGRPVRPGWSFTLRAGEILRIGGTPVQMRAYLCVAGGFRAAKVLGSTASWEPIQAGQVLDCSESECRGRAVEVLPPERGPLRVIAGPQAGWFTSGLAGEYEVSHISSRMGIRLIGQRLERQPGEMVSEPVAPGSVQITNDGQPIILGVDGQTIGGYPKIAQVIEADLDRVGQLRPGERVSFTVVSLAEAARLAREYRAELRRWAARLRLFS